MKLILLGAPGAGKGTQAAVLCEKYAIPAISTGNIIREAISTGTQAGLEAKKYVESGALVPDEVVIAMIQDRLAQDDCAQGYILDGFPRTVPQARALDQMGVVIDTVLDIEVPDEKIVARMSGRRVCAKCSASYHVEYNPSAKGEQCEKCDGDLTIRADDAPETVAERLRVYHEQTEPLKDYYNAAGKLTVVIGQEKVEDTTALVLGALEA